MTQIVFKKGKFLVVAMIISEGKVGIHHLLLLGETNDGVPGEAAGRP